MMTLAELRARLSAIETERREIHTAAGDDALAEEQQTRWDELDTEEIQVRADIVTAERRERVDASRRQYGARLLDKVDPWDGSDVRTLNAPQARDKALAVLDDRDSTEHLSDGQKTRLERTLRTQSRNTNGGEIGRRMLITENPDYRNAFMKLATTPNAILTPEEARAVQAFQEYRAMSIGTDTAGGFGVPVLIDPTIILDEQGHPNDFFRLARVETITNDEWKGVSSAGVSWQFRAEGATASDNSPTLAQPSVAAHRADGYIPYTIEVGMDYPGFAAEMSTLLAAGYSELLVEKFTNGSGTNEPFGIVTALTGTASSVDLAAAGTIAAGDVNGVWAALPIRYRSNAAWMMHTSTDGDVQQLGNGNDAAFTVNFTAEGVPLLKGKPVNLNDYFVELGDAGGGGIAVVGDWRNYLIAQRAGMSIELVPHVFDTSGASSLPTGERAWFAWARVGADSINDKGFRMLNDTTV